MKQFLFIITLAFVTCAGAQTTAVQVQQGTYKNKKWKYQPAEAIDLPVLFNYPWVSVGDSTYRLTDNIGDTATALYSIHVSHCVNNKHVIGVLAISIYKDGSYYLSVTYGDLIRRYTLKYNDYEMGNK